MGIELSEVKGLIEAALPGSEAEVVDERGGDHLAVTVTAPQFAGLSRIDQHRLVKSAVREQTDSGAIHSLTVRTIVADD